MEEPNWLVRRLVWYSKITEFKEGECIMHGANLLDVQELWDLPEDDPMVECFDVSEVQASFLQEHVDTIINLNKYDYSLEACTSDFKKSKKDGGFMGLYPPPC